MRIMRIVVGILWKTYGTYYEYNVQTGIEENQIQDNHFHVVFWQDTVLQHGSYILTSSEETPTIAWGGIERVENTAWEQLTLCDDKPLLDCDEYGHAAWVLSHNPVGETEILVTFD